MRRAALALALVAGLGGCAALRTGWARVEWMEGGPSPEVVCQCSVRGDEVEMRCVSLETVSQHLLRRVPSRRNEL